MGVLDLAQVFPVFHQECVPLTVLQSLGNCSSQEIKLYGVSIVGEEGDAQLSSHSCPGPCPKLQPQPEVVQAEILYRASGEVKLEANLSSAWPGVCVKSHAGTPGAILTTTEAFTLSVLLVGVAAEGDVGALRVYGVTEEERSS